MKISKIHQWKKVYEADLDYIVGELKDLLKFPALLLLSGDLGSGKTTLAKKITAKLGQNKHQQQTSSPSYSLINDYGNILHADFYRLKNASELEQLELGLYLEGKDILLIEWGRDYLPALIRELPEHIFCYELMIDFVDKTPSGGRHYQLNQISE